jgi:hypothetical protein
MASAIGSVNQLVKVIQSQLAQRKSETPAGKRGEAAQQQRTQRYAQENLGALIELRVRQIARDDQQRGRKVFRVFLEAVLLSHFGEHLVNDPRFFQMVDEVQAAMEHDSGCRELVGRAIEQLLAEI